MSKHQIYPALVRNKSQLAYRRWRMAGRALIRSCQGISLQELQAQLKLQDEAAQALKMQRYRHGALKIETAETHPVILNDKIVDLVRQEKNRATELIEDFMIAANGVVARTVEKAVISSIRRVVKTPERWDRIVALASSMAASCPPQPDSKALNDFLHASKTQTLTTSPISHWR